MKITSFGHAGERNGVLEFPWRWGAAFLGQRRIANRADAGRTIEFALGRNALWRIAGQVRGVSIDCRQGRLWLTQAGAAADVILQPGQRFEANAGGAIVVQSVPSVDAVEQASLGALTVPGGASRLQIHRRQTAAASRRIGMDSRFPDRRGRGEHLAFIALWLCGAFSVWYCLKSVLSLAWAQ